MLSTGFREHFGRTPTLLPEYVNQDFLVELLNTAGRLIGIGDFRPTYGRFVLKSFNAR